MILALKENGEIVEQGSFSDLNIPGSYIHTLQVKLQKEEQEHGGVAVVETQFDDEKTKELVEVEEKTEVEVDETRQLGNWSIYRYYGHALGPLALATWIFFLGSGQTFVGLGGKCSPIHIWAMKLLHSLTHLKRYGSTGGLRTMKGAARTEQAIG